MISVSTSFKPCNIEANISVSILLLANDKALLDMRWDSNNKCLCLLETIIGSWSACIPNIEDNFVDSASNKGAIPSFVFVETLILSDEDCCKSDLLSTKIIFDESNLRFRCEFFLAGSLESIKITI